MASTAAFPEQNWHLQADADHQSVPCYVDAQSVTSCWQLSPEELAEVLRTGRIYLTIVGEATPPVYVSGLNPFQQPGQPNDVVGCTTVNS